QPLAERLAGRHQANGGVDAVVAAGEQAQALPGLIQQLGLGQDAAADRHHGVGGEDEGALQLVVELDAGQRGFRLLAGETGGVGARDLAPARRFIEIGGLERVRLDPGLIDERQPPRRAGCEHEFGAADHAGRVNQSGWALKRTARKLAEVNAYHNMRALNEMNGRASDAELTLPLVGRVASASERGGGPYGYAM